MIEKASEASKPAVKSTLKRGKTIIVYGSRYDFYPTLKDERDAVVSGNWQPATRDLKATADEARADLRIGIGSYAELMTLLLSRDDNSIKDLYIIGHSNTNMIGFGGELEPGNIRFSNVLDRTEIDDMTDSEKQIVAKKFIRNARVFLIGCNSVEQPGGLLEPISLGWAEGKKPLCVIGFSDKISWCIQFSSSGNRVISRGRIAIGNPPGFPPCKRKPWMKLTDLEGKCP